MPAPNIFHDNIPFRPDSTLNGGRYHYPDGKPLVDEIENFVPSSIQWLTKKLCLLENMINHGIYGKDKSIPIRTAIGNLLAETKVNLKELEPWIDRKHSPRDSYGRKAIFTSDTLEVMVMTWLAGDVCALHDHGSAEHGAVKFMGPSELMHVVAQTNNATGLLQTINLRSNHKTGEILQVSHELCHCMGNISHRFGKINKHKLLVDPENLEDNYGITLHVYWKSGDKNDNLPSVTGGARVLDLVQGKIYQTDAGVFHGLPKSQTRLTNEQVEADFPTLLRDGTEQLVRLIRMTPEERAVTNALPISDIFQCLFAPERKDAFIRDVCSIVDAKTGHSIEDTQWKILCHALRTAAPLQYMTIPGIMNKINKFNVEGDNQKRDLWKEYARMYDALIGKPCMDSFMSKYIKFFFDQVWLKETGRSISRSCKVMSIGCGTGLIERYMLDEFQISPQNLTAFDLSPSMVETAIQLRGILTAKVGNVLEMCAETYGLHDVLYAGLNVFQYLPADKLNEAFERTAACTKEGGYFVSDFITPDHIRWYPNLMISTDWKTFSLRTPRLVEKNCQMYQQSDIINVTWDTKDDHLKINDSGLHERWLAPISRIIDTIQKSFSRVRVFDAVSMEKLPHYADTSPSTRYVVIANK